LDTKLKSNNSKYIITSVIFLLLIILSAGIYSTYPLIKEQAKGYEYNIFERKGFLNNLSTSNYGIYYDTLKNNGDSTLKPSDVLVNEEKSNNEDINSNMYYNLKALDRDIYSYQESLSFDGNLRNLDYYAVNKQNTLVKERNHGEISALLSDNPDSSSLEALNSKYDFYIVIDYNEKGDMTVKRIYGADKLIATEILKDNRISNPYNMDIKPIKNMTYIYAVPKVLQYQDSIYGYKTQNRMHSYNGAASNFVNPALLLILFIGLVIPYGISKELIGFKRISRIPFEIASVISMLTIGAVLYDVSYSMISGTLEGDLINLSPLVADAAVINILESIANILFWTVSFGVVFITVVLLKYIWNTGIRQYLRGNSIIYKFLSGIWRTNKRAYNYLRNIDLKSKENKRIVILLLINLLILTIMSSIWFFGIILAIIYTIVAFRIITKNFSDISSKYNKLLQATNKIAEGNLDVNIEEDLGLFNSLKKELQNIQKGFKKAVSEEVKSQKMKTELITNVSHDLKTPLTSIITYVDLLKDENLPIEKRREYLETLDRKSQRLKDLIEDLFEVSKATSGNISLNIVDVDIVALMKQTLLEVDDKITSAALSVRTNYPEEKVILPLDSQRMFRVFENLIINITKYALIGSRVYIDVINNTDKVEVVLRNMAANEIEFSVDDIMERFVRGDKSRNTEGSGLGLAIAKSFVELQGGKLDIIVDGDLFKVVITFSKN
jgi:signal transduction histidine kinase